MEAKEKDRERKERTPQKRILSEVLSLGTMLTGSTAVHMLGVAVAARDWLQGAGPNRKCSRQRRPSIR